MPRETSVIRSTTSLGRFARSRRQALPRIAALSVLLFVGFESGLAPAPLQAQGDASPTGEWQLEKMWSKGGREYRGLLLDKTEKQLEFAEIVRPPGKAMSAIIHALPADKVVGVQRLPPAERAKLVERFNTFRNRAVIEAGNMEAVSLVPRSRAGTAFLTYEGPWFTMWSTADEETTRRSIVRIEQSFRAYRQLLPPQVAQGNSFEIYLYGSSLQYRSALERWNAEIAHPAFFSVDENVVVAGTDLDGFSRELERVRQENERTRQLLKSLRLSHEQTLAQVSTEMKQAGFAADAVESEIRSRRAAWKEQQEQLEEAIDQAGQRNTAKFHEVSRTMFQRLNHEAFHAYLENYVYRSNRYDMPRWLNEGLAQVFEHAQLDADTLRIDAPAKTLLAQLQLDLKRDQPLPLAELLEHDEALLAVHQAEGASQRRYLYAWGLAHYLAFHSGSLTSPEFEAYVAKQPQSRSSVERFERWIKRPLHEFEAQWRRDMLALR